MRWDSLLGPSQHVSKRWELDVQPSSEDDAARAASDAADLALDGLEGLLQRLDARDSPTTSWRRALRALQLHRCTTLLLTMAQRAGDIEMPAILWRLLWPLLPHKRMRPAHVAFSTACLGGLRAIGSSSPQAFLSNLLLFAVAGWRAVARHTCSRPGAMLSANSPSHFHGGGTPAVRREGPELEAPASLPRAPRRL